MKKCPNCNKLVHDEATVCRFCGHDVTSQDIEIDTSGESQRSRYPEDTSLRLILGGCSGMVVVSFIFSILTVYLYYYIGTTGDSGAAYAFWFVVIPGFFICTVVAFSPGALGGLLGGRIAVWMADRYSRAIPQRISAIIGGAMVVLVPVFVFVLFMYILDVLGSYIF